MIMTRTHTHAVRFGSVNDAYFDFVWDTCVFVESTNVLNPVVLVIIIYV